MKKLLAGFMSKILKCLYRIFYWEHSLERYPISLNRIDWTLTIAGWLLFASAALWVRFSY